MAGYYLLTLMHKEGVQFLASGPWMRALCSEITGHPTAAHEGNSEVKSTQCSGQSHHPKVGTEPLNNEGEERQSCVKRRKLINRRS